MARITGNAMTLTFTLTDKLEPSDIKLLGEGLTAHSAEMGFPAEWKDFAIFARDASGAVRGGIAGNSGQNMLYIRLLWVHATERGKGLGRRLMEMAEAEGVRRGCHVAGVDTFTYQAPQFYPKLGYREFGRVDGLGEKRDLTRFWFMKRIG